MYLKLKGLLIIRKGRRKSIPRMMEDDYPYAEVVQESKWGIKNLRRVEINNKKGTYRKLSSEYPRRRTSQKMPHRTLQ